MGAGHRPVPGPLTQQHNRIIDRKWPNDEEPHHSISRNMGQAFVAPQRPPSRVSATSTPTFFRTGMMCSLISETMPETYPRKTATKRVTQQ
jgi:hypothetical protein